MANGVNTNSAKQNSGVFSFLYSCISLIPLFATSLIISSCRIIEGAITKDEAYSPFFDWATVCISCLLLILGIACTIHFRRKAGIRIGFQYKVLQAELVNDKAISFFLSVILPGVSNAAIDGLVGFACFWLMNILIMILITKTDLCFENPALVIMGFNLYLLELKQCGEDALGHKKNKSSTIIVKAIASNKNTIKVNSYIVLKALSPSYSFAVLRR